MTILASYVFWFELKRKWLGFLVCSGWKKKQSRATPSHLLHHQEQCFGTNMEVGLVNGALPSSATGCSGLHSGWHLNPVRLKSPPYLVNSRKSASLIPGPGQSWWLCCLPSLLKACSHCSRWILPFRGVAGKWQGLDKGRKVITLGNLSALVFHLPFLWCHFFFPLCIELIMRRACFWKARVGKSCFSCLWAVQPSVPISSWFPVISILPFIKINMRSNHIFY